MSSDATPPPGRTAAVELAPQLALLIGESQALRGDLHSAEEARRRAGRINIGILAVLAVFVLLLLVNAVESNRLTHRLSETNKRIADCTTEGGTCNEEGRARTSSAISDIIRAEIFMAECSRLFPGEAGQVFDQHLEQCVSARLAGPGLTTPAPPVASAPSVAPSPR